MLFNSYAFTIFFFPVFYILYLFSRRHLRKQNAILLVASYLFYGFWDWRFLSLILISTCVDFFVGKSLDATEEPARRKWLVTVSVVSNLSMLGFFKYFHFFAGSLSELMINLGMEPDYPTLNIILPIGISFYTFQTLSYTIDVYRRKVSHTDNLLDFALFVAFFPQLVAGPIERAASLLPQIQKRRIITAGQIEAGVFLIIFGYFKKVVIADNVGIIADEIFNNYLEYDGLALLVGALAFAVQIYCDFSGYSDIARGLCKLLGIEIMVNFRLPYFALNPSDFWCRWHVSLSSWLRDYLYVSLGGNRCGTLKTYRNLMLTMLLGGLWHGAAWNFVIWGAYHGMILCIYRIFDRRPEHKNPRSGNYAYLRIYLKMGLMFALTLIGWVIFRSQSVGQMTYMLTHMGIDFSRDSLKIAYNLAFFVLPLALMELAQYRSGDLLIVAKQKTVIQGLVYGFMLVGIVVFGVRDSLEFIYFQF